MIERQKRLKEVYEYLRDNCGIHTQIDFANALKYSRSVISSALNGNEAYLTDSLFKNISESFPGVFQLDYLLTGVGSLLADSKATPEQSGSPSDMQSVIDAIMAANAKVIAQLEYRLAERDEYINGLRRQIQLLEDRVAGMGPSLRSDDYSTNFMSTSRAAESKDYENIDK